MAINVTSIDQYVRTSERRMPFHFGNVAADRGAHLFLDLEFEIEGARTSGVSMGGIAPMWFLKDPDLTLVEQSELLFEMFDAACEQALTPASSVFDLWYDLFNRMQS